MLEQNEHPINQACKQILDARNQLADPNYLYLHQAILDQLESENHGLVKREQAVFLADLLWQLETTNPALLLKWMSVDEGSVGPEALLELDAEEAAQVLIQVLHIETAARIEAYP